MSRGKVVVVVVAILCATLVLLSLMSLMRWQYFEGGTQRVDRITGRFELLGEHGWVAK